MAARVTNDNHPYENQILGAFMVGIGLSLAKSGLPGVAVSMTQQTPLDAYSDDLQIGAWSFVAIEFKRRDDHDALKSEREKLDVECVKKNLWTPKGELYYEKSLDMHFLVFYSQRQVLCRPYLQWFLEEECELKPAVHIIDSVFTPGHSDRTRNHLVEYMKWLKQCEQGKSGGGGGARVDPNYSMVVAISPEGDVITFNFEQFEGLTTYLDNRPPPDAPVPSRTTGNKRQP